MVFVLVFVMALCAEGKEVKSKEGMNQLKDSTSAYLRSAAGQPVHWREWSPEAFEAARQQDRPVLLDVGAVWCHWCHVIDRESYENPEIGRMINEAFIPIKVDVDARPDVDRRYQEVVQALTGQGGWPLTVFLTPEGQVIYGGTYFPPEDRGGMPGMKTILARVAQVYRDQKADVVAQAKRLHEELAKVSEQSLRSGTLNIGLLEKILANIQNSFDEEHGGFGEAPKFPAATGLELLLGRALATGNDRYVGMVTQTLDAMAAGGIRDQLGGAFHRYSTDRFWRVPHFEVMLYVEAEMLKLYAQAYQRTGRPRYAQVMEQLLGYLKTTLSDRSQGGFYGSQDADATPDDDGDYWTWTLAEARAILGPEELEVAARFYGIEAQGEMRENPAKNVLYEAGTPPQDRLLLARAQGKLLQARSRRKAPYVDTTIYTNWNALMVSGMLAASAALGQEEPKEFALKTLDRIWNQGHRSGQGLFHVLQGQNALVPGFLEDYAYLLVALLDAHEATQDPIHLERARELAEEMIARFGDEKQGGFFDSRLESGAAGILSHRRKPIQDAPTPGANSMAALGLTRLFHYTGEAKYRGLAEKSLTSFAGTAQEYGLFTASFGIALEALLREPTHVVIIGRKEDPKTQGLVKAALTPYRPDRLIQTADPQTDRTTLPAPVAELLKSLGSVKEPTAFVCSGTQCAAPVTKPEELKHLVESFK